jgi:hypothetical protein
MKKAMMQGQIKTKLVELIQQLIRIPIWMVHLVITWPTNRGQWQRVEEEGRMMMMIFCFRLLCLYPLFQRNMYVKISSVGL